MHELEMRKLRSLAKPLEPKMDAGGERRFFQWSLGTKGEIKEWEKGKGFDKTKKTEKVWVPLVCPTSCLLIVEEKLTVDYTSGEDPGYHDNPIESRAPSRSESSQCTRLCSSLLPILKY
jgi:hypothetical protein